MTREEQIIEKAGKDSEIFYKVNGNYGDCFHGGFIDGAKWADENPKSELVNKQEFIAKLKMWLEINTNWDMEYDEEGRNDNYGKIDELVKYLEE